MENKYELLKNDYKEIDGQRVYRIRALRDFMYDPNDSGHLHPGVRKGMLGGYIQSERNLSHEGDCWIGSPGAAEETIVYGISRVEGDGMVRGDIQVKDTYITGFVDGKRSVIEESKILDNAWVHNFYDGKILGCHISGNANIRYGGELVNSVFADDANIVGGQGLQVRNSEIKGQSSVISIEPNHAPRLENAFLSDRAMARENAAVLNSTISGNGAVGGEAVVSDSYVAGYAGVGGKANVDNSVVIGKALVYGDAHVSHSKVQDTVRIYRGAVVEQSVIAGDARITGDAVVRNFKTKEIAFTETVDTGVHDAEQMALSAAPAPEKSRIEEICYISPSMKHRVETEDGRHVPSYAIYTKQKDNSLAGYKTKRGSTMDNDLIVSGVEVSAPDGMEKEFKAAVRDIVVRIADTDKALSEKLHAEWLDYSKDSVARNGLVLPDTKEEYGYSVYGHPDGENREMDIRFDHKFRNHEKIPGFFYGDKQFYSSDMYGRSLFHEQQLTFILDGKKFAEVLKEEYGLDVRVRNVEFACLSENHGYDIVSSEVRPSLVKGKENMIPVENSLAGYKINILAYCDTLEEAKRSAGENGYTNIVVENVEKKYELAMDEAACVMFGKKHYRIRALRDIPVHGIPAGRVGGFVESEKNLSQEGDCWVAHDALVTGDACVTDNAVVSGRATVMEQAKIQKDAQVSGYVVVTGNAVVGEHALVTGNAVVMDEAKVLSTAYICGDAQVCGKSKIGNATVKDRAVVMDSFVWGEAHISGDAVVVNNARLHNGIKLIGYDYAEGNMPVQEQSGAIKKLFHNTRTERKKKPFERNRTAGKEMKPNVRK